MRPASAPLLDLSPEILLQILECLCPHCSGEVDVTDTQGLGTCDSQTLKASQFALYGLSRSCKAMRNIAQPFLYHYIAHTKKAELLARTLLQRPALGREVEELAITAVGFTSQCDKKLSEEDREILEVQAQAVDANALEKDTFKRKNILGMLMLAHTPNVQRLSVLTDSSVSVMYYPHGALSYLTILRANCDDTGSGFGLSVLAGIMKAAPNLKTFVGFNLTRVNLKRGEIFSESVTEVNLAEATTGTRDFKMLMRGFPNLQVFRFETDRSRYFARATPAEMAKYLLARKETLKEINISASASAFPDITLMRNEVIDDLAGMTSLETIILNSDSIYSEYDNASYTNGLYLVGLLPESVRVLGLVNPPDHLKEDILRLAASAPKRFPLLKKVMFQHVGKSKLKAYKKAFKKPNIECVMVEGLDTIVRG